MCVTTMSEAFDYFDPCNCCDSGRPPEIQFFLAFRNKSIIGKFCGTGVTSIGSQGFPTVLSGYNSLVQPENLTLIVDPPNPTTGELHTDISVSYQTTTREDIEPEEGFCFDGLAGGYNETSALYSFTRSTNPELRISFQDSTGIFYRKPVVEQETDLETGELVDVLDEGGNTIPVLDANGEQVTEKSYLTTTCPEDCGSPNNPFLEGETLQIFESLSVLGICCCEDGDTLVTEEIFDREVYESSTAKSCASFGSFDTTGSYTREQKSEANCAYNIVCGAVRYTHPGGEVVEPFIDEPTNSIASFPPLDENTSAQLGEPTLIEDVIAKTEESFLGTPYSVDQGSIWFGDPNLTELIAPVNFTVENPGSFVTATRNFFSVPFASFGFGNFCQLELSGAEYRIAFAESPGTCYVKLWFDEQFLPLDPLPEGEYPQVTGSFSIEQKFPTTSNKSCFVEINDRGLGPNGAFYPANFIYHYEVRQLLPPAISGTNILRVRKYSFVEGYEPNDPFLVPYEDGEVFSQGCKPNGFPINPATEACGP